MAKIVPSVFGADIGRINEQLEVLEKNGIDLLHVDMMDGSFVPNIAFGPDQIKMMKKGTKLQFDVHMMVYEPDRYIPRLVEAGAHMITVHQEATTHLHRTIQLIKSYGVRAGVVLNPGTPPSTLEYVLDDIDCILLMTVNPGLGGQKFFQSSLEKIRKTKTYIGNRPIQIEVDGGVNAELAKECTLAGADLIVVGSYLFEGDIEANLEKLSKGVLTE
ncbi:ribulose-phosphate 3-epimerase [Listeria monocytogenes]|uniref:ribulose-phosphate 3-epimerase n=1 Tax=Listeria monocytogenes TaxID=1639 RepID=UPI0010B4F51B|nr:ribulose-phosphate 3-epimerase [Listeria monocytogenes]EAC4171677.1 ribulose-phosphate 3-epimerase [Listeria monocytogenes]EAF4052861.1 ribulose-phosphate 3-epimerase [Listeria monocytogenes]EGN3548793.1 ribulose-phosphate 3-epimerase [Listeria monocytogenes]ELB8839696.1 ribulose-phosphate 3-epimerase [Listeria monocytogenes]TYU75626.1 ribulose-phosphate 3-epimerase [Listeria monocytogenes]